MHLFVTPNMLYTLSILSLYYLYTSLASNCICGMHGVHGKGTYTTEGITKLCEGLKGSGVTSLRCP